ncbi:MAG: hypothetical protein OTI36_11090 [Beijerinckiaceae bacterium]|nr:hypothetical protein [Beijerinckiaceae bacterium]
MKPSNAMVRSKPATPPSGSTSGRNARKYGGIAGCRDPQASNRVALTLASVRSASISLKIS